MIASNFVKSIYRQIFAVERTGGKFVFGASICESRGCPHSNYTDFTTCSRIGKVPHVTVINFTCTGFCPDFWYGRGSGWAKSF